MRRLVTFSALLLAAPIAFANARPEPQADRYLLRQGESVDVRPPGVLGNDTDTEGDTLFVEPADSASAGQLILFPDGSFSYTPDSRFAGVDRFTYRACDNDACSEPVEVRLEGDGIPAPLATRPDRFEVVAGSNAIDLDVVSNDAFDLVRLQGGRLDLTRGASLGDVGVVDNGAALPGLAYRPHHEAVGTDRFRYRLCEAAGRCAEADVEVVILPFAAVQLDVSGAAGFMDVPVRGLPTLPEPSLVITETAKPSTYSFPIAVDATPLEPWAGGGTAQTMFTAEGGESGRELRVRVSIESDDGDVDLYVGMDSDGDGRGTSDESTCASAGVRNVESCVLELSIPAAGRVRWWAHAHNREAKRIDAKLEVREVDVANSSTLTWTAPGRLEAGGSAAFRVSWKDLSLLPGEARDAWIRVESEPRSTLGWVPLTLVGPDRQVAPRLLVGGSAVRFDLPFGSAAEALVIDAPVGTSMLEVSASAEGGFELALFRAPAPVGDEPTVGFSPPTEGDLPAAVVRSADGLATIRLSEGVPGRWFARIANATADLSEVAVEARLEAKAASAAALRPGLYGPAVRPGEGLVVDQTGGDWSAVWYAFDESRASTWLYLQGPAPEEGAAWTPTIYRSAMRDAGQRLVAVGQASLSIIDEGGPVFSFEVDGRVGSQRLLDFGRGCPIEQGEPRDFSGLWYDPAIAGEGYGVWITPTYEFYGLFTHDARGQPRYLSAEGVGFSVLGDRLLPLASYRGACLFCPRATREGETVGQFSRLFAPALSPILTLVDATLGSGVVGSVSRSEALERLGSEGAGFGCPGK